MGARSVARSARSAGSVASAVLAVLVTLASLLIASAERVEACSCSIPTLERILSDNEAIVIGEVTDVHDLGGATTDEYDSAGDERQRLTVAVSTIVLGDSAPTVTATVEVDNGGNCGVRDARVGQTIALTRYPGGGFSSSDCVPSARWLRSAVREWVPPAGGQAHGVVLGAWESQIAFLDASGDPIGYANPFAEVTDFDVCTDGRTVAGLGRTGGLVIARSDSSTPPIEFPLDLRDGIDVSTISCAGPDGSATRAAVFRPEAVATTLYQVQDGELVGTVPAPGRGLHPLMFHGDVLIVSDQRTETLEALSVLDPSGEIRDLTENTVGDWRIEREPTGRFALAVATTPRNWNNPDEPGITHMALLDLSGTTPQVSWERTFHERYDAAVLWGPDAEVVALQPGLHETATRNWRWLDTATSDEPDDAELGVRIGEAVILPEPGSLAITEGEHTRNLSVGGFRRRLIVLPLNAPLDVAPGTLHHPEPRLEAVVHPEPVQSAPPTTSTPVTTTSAPSDTSSPTAREAPSPETDDSVAPDASDTVPWRWLAAGAGLLILLAGGTAATRSRATRS